MTGRPASPPRLPDAAKRWLDEGTYVTVGTIGADGRPHLSVVWATYDGDDVLFSTLTGRRKYRNIMADPNVSVLWFPRDDPLSYVEVRGTATASTDGAIELVERLARTYVGRPYREVPGDVVRVTVRVRPVNVVLRGR
jgi:PPOX class probable F420-dependent enzyme